MARLLFYLCITSLICNTCVHISAQIEYDNLMYPMLGTTNATPVRSIPISPQAASLGKYGLIPVSHFTGVPEISIPLHNVKYKELELPISLKYHSAGQDPDNFPGSVGLGWSLFAGGVISRSIDGCIDYGPKPKVGDIIPLGHDSRYEDYNPGKMWVEYPDELNSSMYWYSDGKLNSNIPLDGQPLRYSEPDKYIYTIGPNSGCFYETWNRGEFLIQSQNSAYFKVEIMLKDKIIKPTLYNNNTHIIKGFRMTDKKGVQYYFEEEEYVREGINQLGDYQDEFDSMDRIDGVKETVPTSWYLTKIVSPNGYSIVLKYKTITNIVNKYIFRDFVMTDNTSTSIPRNIKNLRATTTNLKILESIITPIESLSFYSDNSSQLYYPTQVVTKRDRIYKFSWYDNILYRTRIDEDGNIYPLIKDLTIINNAENTRLIYTLNYTSNPEERAKLESIDVAHVSPVDSKYKHMGSYSFKYNSNKLPPYLSGMTDYYGYYNGRNYFNLHINENSKDSIEYYKASDPILAQSEILTEIKYPTGGRSVFEYEGNYYGKQVKKWPLKIEDCDNTLTGGVRIKRITDYDNNNKSYQKIYHYVHDYINGGNKSSGVLAYKPELYEEYNLNGMYCITPSGNTSSKLTSDYYRYTSNPIYNLNINGNHISYSEVTEEDQYNGYTVFKYQNHDNGFADKAPLNYRTFKVQGLFIDYCKHDPGISMELERGLVSEISIYDISKQIKQKKQFTYNNDTNRFKQNIRYYRYRPAVFALCYPSFRYISAGVHYMYYPFLQEIKEENYVSESEKIVRNEVSKYINRYRLIKYLKKTNSNNKKDSVLYIYPMDKLEESNNLLFTKMYLSSFFPVLETEVYSGNNRINKTINTYELYKNTTDSIFSLGSISEFRETDTNCIKNIKIENYIKPECPIHIKNNDGSKTTLIWDELGLNPILAFHGPEYFILDNIVDNYMKKWDYIYDNISLIQKNNADFNIILYGYSLNDQISTIIKPNGLHLEYEYDASKRLKKEFMYKKDQKEMLKEYNYIIQGK